MDSTYRIGHLEGSDTLVALATEYDDWAGDGPRKEWDNVTHLYTWSRGYASPDDNPYDEPRDFIEAALREAYDDDAEALLEAVLATKGTPFRLTRDDSDPDGPMMVLEKYGNALLVNRSAWLAGPMWPASDDGMGEVGEAEDEVFSEVADWSGVLRVLEGRCALVPIYMLDHSGIAYSTTPFCDSWDSGQVGWGYMSLAEARAEWGVYGRSDADVLSAARAAIASDVRAYSAWVEGDVLSGRVLSLDGEHDDACGGFYGYESDEARLRSVCECFGVTYDSLEDIDADDDDEALDAVRRRRDAEAHERAVASGQPYRVFHYHKMVPVDVVVAVPDGDAHALDAFTENAAFAAECDAQRQDLDNEVGHEGWQDESDVTDGPDELGRGDLPGFVSGTRHAYVVDADGHIVMASEDSVWARDAD